ncbi:MAG: TolB family protein, partial [Candidatus Kapaibacteriota bacterium]
MNLKKILILCVYLVLISTNLSAQKKLIKLAEKDLVNFNAKEMLSLNRIGEMSISPDGKWILYSMSKPDISKNKSYKNLYVVSIDGTNTKQITEGTYSDFNPVWSPDGSKIAFISTRMGSPQIFTMNFPDGKPQGLTAFKDGVENLKWSPDGKYLSFSYEIKMMDNMNDKYPEYKLAQVYSYYKLQLRHLDS